MINIFEIERYATKDGPGIRTVLFLKGCNLRCLWCQNPESQSAELQVMYYKNKCTGCGRCMDSCPDEAIVFSSDSGFLTDHSKCSRCGRCIDSCFYNARQMIGMTFTDEELMEKILADRSFYEESGGGVTFSGGEPLLQHDAVISIADKCRAEGIHTAIETAGAVSRDIFKKVIGHIDLVYIDLKHTDSDIHKKYTGAGNEKILENIITLGNTHDNVIIRIPVIPDFNDNAESIKSIFSFIIDNTGIKKVELLPFHRIGLGKYEGLGMRYKYADFRNTDDSECSDYESLGRSMGLSVRIGAD